MHQKGRINIQLDLAQSVLLLQSEQGWTHVLQQLLKQKPQWTNMSIQIMELHNLILWADSWILRVYQVATIMATLSAATELSSSAIHHLLLGRLSQIPARQHLKLSLNLPISVCRLIQLLLQYRFKLTHLLSVKTILSMSSCKIHVRVMP